MSSSADNIFVPQNLPPSHPKAVFEHQGIAPAPSKTFCHLSLLNTTPKPEVIWREWPQIRPSQKYSHEAVDPKEHRVSWEMFGAILKRVLPLSIETKTPAPALSLSNPNISDEQREELERADFMKDRILATFGEQMLHQCLNIMKNPPPPRAEQNKRRSPQKTK